MTFKPPFNAEHASDSGVAFVVDDRGNPVPPEWIAEKLNALQPAALPTAPAESAGERAGLTEEERDLITRVEGMLDSREIIRPNDTLRDLLAIIDRLTAAKPQAAEGFVLVPKEPTEEMLVALTEKSNRTFNGFEWHDYMRKRYAAMLAAAPTPQEKEKGR
jgi:hypothetical protein